MGIRLFIIFTILYFNVFGANNDIDSLKNSLQKTEQKAKILSQIADKYMYISSELAEKYANNAILQAKREHDTIVLAEIFRIKGIIKYNQSEVDSAFYYFYKSSEISKNTNNTYDQASTLVNIGGLFFELKEYDRCEQAFLDALELFKKTDSKKGISTIYNNLGLLYQQKNNYKKSIEYLYKSKEIKDELYDKIGGAKLLINIAIIHKTHFKDYKQALELLNKSLLIFTELKSDIFISQTYNNISGVYLESNNLSDAKINALTALNIASKNKFEKVKSQSNNLLFNIYKLENNYRKALEYYTALENYNKEKLSENNNKLLQNVKIKYETEQKEEQLIAKQQQLTNKTNQFTYLLIFSLLLVGLLVLVYIQKLRVTLANKDLVKRNIEIANVEKEHEETHAELEAIIDNIKNEKPELNKKISQNVFIANENEIIAEIKNCMNKDEIYLDKSLTIVSLAKKLNTNKTYLSKVINETFDKNFSTYINEYRIKYSRQLLIDNVSKKYTIEYISETSGFNSVTAFNKAFKRFTGITPSFFIKNIDTELHIDS